MSVESMEWDAHETGVHVAEAALKLVTCGQEGAQEELYYQTFLIYIEPAKPPQEERRSRRY